MSVREYVGARYVPLFANPLEWSNENTYEPLTIVQHEGNSYTSRQFVPSGIDIKNAEYWALTGNYNAQIEQYRQEVQTFDERITQNANDIEVAETEIETNKSDIEGLQSSLESTDSYVAKNHIVIIGDSFTSVTGAREYNWPSKLHTRYTVHNYASNGAGFSRVGLESGREWTFGQQLTQAINDPAFENDSVKTVIVYGGINDFLNNVSANDASNALKSLWNSATTSFKNANVIIVIGNAGVWTNSNHSGYTLWCDQVQRFSRGIPLVNANWWLWGFGVQTVFNDDKLHPNATGSEFIASYMAALIEGCFTPSEYWYTLQIAGDTDLAIRFNPAGQMKVVGKAEVQVANGSGVETVDIEYNSAGALSTDPQYTGEYTSIPYTASSPAIYSCFLNGTLGKITLWYDQTKITSAKTENVFF